MPLPTVSTDYLPPLTYAGSGGRNFKYRYTATDLGISSLAGPRSPKQAQDVGDFKLDLGQAYLWGANNGGYINAPDEQGIENINNIIESIGGSLPLTKVARLDICTDVTAPDAEKWHWRATQIKTRSQNFEEIKVGTDVFFKSWSSTKPMSVNEVYTGFTVGNDSGVGQGMLRVYRKDIELQLKGGHDIYCAVHDLDPTDMPAIWRVEHELRGAVLTELDLRYWSRFSELRGGLLRRLCGLDDTDAPGKVKHTGYRVVKLAHDYERRHRLWQAVEANALSTPAPVAVKRRQHKRHISAGYDYRLRQARKALLEWQAYRAYMLEHDLLQADRAGLEEPSPDALARAIKKIETYYRGCEWHSP